MTSRPVLVFDSGVGGLSVTAEIRRRLPTVPLLYLMDSAGFPYGIKDDATLITRVVDVCADAVAEASPRMLVVACNTASTLALPALRERLAIPVVGVVPALKVAAQACPGGEIGLLATPATVHRPYTDNLIREFAAGCRVRRLGSTALVQWAEDWVHHGRTPQGLFDHLDNWLTQPAPVTHVVLGCTHFPLLTPTLTALWPGVHWIDSGEAIARRVAQLLGDDIPSGGRPAPQLRWTGDHPPGAGVAAFLAALP
ncbi:glutamate racemase [Alcanivorax quisquiliarum]|uniref:Glutamate racemase n=1 Tax=Alcanivorax quisquiliarum TaxID=2933565 RepID=A0ABT0E6G9_9GAMM|nr:glutamate racemase [Alcanivorax quisquiliarum]MCK0537424.1 glutamate racemase [Alcanivorax quisquiliarum]